MTVSGPTIFRLSQRRPLSTLPIQPPDNPQYQYREWIHFFSLRIYRVTSQRKNGPVACTRNVVDIYARLHLGERRRITLSFAFEITGNNIIY